MGLSKAEERRIRRDFERRVQQLREEYGADVVEADLKIVVQRAHRKDRPLCGARTRLTGHGQGNPCRMHVAWHEGELRPRKRCRFHGGNCIYHPPRSEEAMRRKIEALARGREVMRRRREERNG